MRQEVCNANLVPVFMILFVSAMVAGCAGYRETRPPERAPVAPAHYYDQAERRAEEILEQLEARLGENHPSLINPLMTLSMVYFRQGRLQESDALLERVWTLIEEHPELTVETLDLPVRYGSLAAAASAHDRLDVRTHLAKSANVNAFDAQGRTALHYAAIHGDKDMAKQLISAGAIVTMRDRQRQTARDYARRFEHEDLVALLDPSRVAELQPDAAEPEDPARAAEPEFDDFDWLDAPVTEPADPVDDEDFFRQPDEVEEDFFLF